MLGHKQKAPILAVVNHPGRFQQGRPRSTRYFLAILFILSIDAQIFLKFNFMLAGNSSGYAMAWTDQGHLFANIYNGTSMISQLDDPAATAPYYIYLAASSQGFAVNWNTASSLIANTFNQGIWSGPTTLATGGALGNPGKLVGGVNSYLCVFSKGDSHLYTAVYAGSSWTVDTSPLDSAQNGVTEYSVDVIDDRYGVIWNQPTNGVNAVYAISYTSGWGTAVRVDNSTNRYVNNAVPKIFATATGMLTSWLEDDGTGLALSASRYSLGNSAWTAENGSPFIPVYRGHASGVDFAVNNAGVLTVVWNQMDSDRSKVLYSIKNGANWSAASEVTGCSSAYHGVDIASNGNTFMITCGTYPGFGVIAHLLTNSVTNGVLGSAQTVITNESPGAFTNGNLATNGQDYALVSPTSGNTISVNMFNSTTGLWQGQQIIATVGYSGYSPAHIVGISSGFAATWWSSRTGTEYSGPFDIFASVYTNGAWSPPVQVNTVSHYWYPNAYSSVISSNSNDVVLSWFSDNGINTSRYDGLGSKSWTTELLLHQNETAGYGETLDSAVLGNGESTVWNEVNSVWASVYDGIDRVATQLSSGFNSSTSVRNTTNQSGYAAVWTQTPVYYGISDVYMARYENGVWTPPLLLESGPGPTYQSDIVAIGSQYHAIWTQGDPSLTVDPNVRRVWISGDF